jgi:SSS family solute:Na+ symporter
MVMANQHPTSRFGWAACWLLVAMPALADDRANFVAILERALQGERGWARIKAAEALVDHDNASRAYEALIGDVDTAPSEERIGVWRVLARAAPTATDRQKFLDQIRTAAFTAGGPDRVHAVEALAKLGAYRDADRSAIEAMASGDPAVAAFPRWYLALTGRRGDEARLVELLDAADPVARWRAAYATARLKEPSAAARVAIAARAGREPVDSSARTVVVSAAYLTANDADRDRWHRLLIEALISGSEASRVVGLESLGKLGTPADLAFLAAAIASADANVRVAAASASLHILERKRTPSTDINGRRE